MSTYGYLQAFQRVHWTSRYWELTVLHCYMFLSFMFLFCIYKKFIESIVIHIHITHAWMHAFAKKKTKKQKN